MTQALQLLHELPIVLSAGCHDLGSQQSER
jgi:hypothetical protein